MLSLINSTIMQNLATLIYLLRTIIFYIALSVWTVFWAILMILFVCLFKYEVRHTIFVKTWCVISINLCRIICGVKWNVKGKENIPDNQCVVISNHQSTWETFFLQTLLTPQTQVIKQELLQIPFFGWAFKQIKPIAINRKDARQAIQQVRDQGRTALERKTWVLIFPEGTRNPVGQLGKFTRGGASLAKAANTNILPIAHNSGTCWSTHSVVKIPGTIQIEIGPIIKTDKISVSEINKTTRNWIEKTLQNDK